MIFVVGNSTEVDYVSSIGMQVLISVISGIIGAIITVAGTLLIFYKGKKEAKKELFFELYFKELFPLVYKPILDEYYNQVNADQENAPYNIDINLIEKTIYNNYTLIKFAPRKIQSNILSLNAKCKSANSLKNYEEKKQDILHIIENIKKEIEENFKEYIDERR